MLRLSSLLAPVLAAGLLSACAGPTSPRVYTLQGEPVPVAQAAQGPQRLIDLAPVVVPERVARRQVVVRDSDTQLRVLEHDRWSSMLPDELTNALSDALQRRLQALDVAQVGAAAGLPVYRINAEVSRLDASLGGEVQATVGWSVRRLGSERVQTCIGQFQEAAGQSVPELVQAHQRLVQTLADAIAVSQQAVDSQGQAPYCRAS